MLLSIFCEDNCCKLAGYDIMRGRTRPKKEGEYWRYQKGRDEAITTILINVIRFCSGHA